MRLVFAALGMVLVLGATALGQSATVTTDLRSPDQVAPAQPPTVTTDLRSPDQVAPAQPPTVTTDLRSPDQVAAPTVSVPTPVADDGGPAAIVFALIGLGAALVLLAGGYFGVRYRHRVAIADDLVAH
jgi:hypothetical protein